MNENHLDLIANAADADACGFPSAPKLVRETLQLGRVPTGQGRTKQMRAKVFEYLTAAGEDIENPYPPKAPKAPVTPPADDDSNLDALGITVTPPADDDSNLDALGITVTPPKPKLSPAAIAKIDALIAAGNTVDVPDHLGYVHPNQREDNPLKPQYGKQAADRGIVDADQAAAIDSGKAKLVNAAASGHPSKPSVEETPQPQWEVMLADEDVPTSWTNTYHDKQRDRFVMWGTCFTYRKHPNAKAKTIVLSRLTVPIYKAAIEACGGTLPEVKDQAFKRTADKVVPDTSLPIAQRIRIALAWLDYHFSQSDT